MQTYRFSPIQNEAELEKAVAYIAAQTTKLCTAIIGKPLPISMLTVFAHFPDEFDNLQKIIKPLGDVKPGNNGPVVTLTSPIRAGSNSIHYLRIRKPDPYRTQVGCDDLDVSDYSKFKKTYLHKHPNNLRCIERPGYEMIEFFHPDFDVFAYVVSRNPWG